MFAFLAEHRELYQIRRAQIKRANHHGMEYPHLLKTLSSPWRALRILRLNSDGWQRASAQTLAHPYRTVVVWVTGNETRSFWS